MSASATDHLEVRWRIKDSDERWCQPVRCAAMSEIVVEKLPHDKQYEFEVRAVSDCGAKSIWVAADYTVPTAAAPTGTPSLTAQSIADGVHLGWTLPIDQPGIWWIVERASAATGPFTQRARVNSTAYTDPETSGSAFFYRVHAENWFGGAGPYSNVVSSQGVSVDALGDDVAAAQAAAAAAQSDATDALDQLTDIGSDDVLSPVEKSVVIRDYAVIQTEQDGIDAQADAYGITTAKSAYDSAISALTTYLGTLTEPVAWDDTSGNTTIVGTTFRSKFNAIYDARQTLLNAIYAAAKQAAADAETAANTYTDAQLTSYVQATVYSQQVAGLQSQIDGQIDSFFGQVDPTTANDPASGWDAAEKQRHKGDTYTNLWNGTAAGGSGTPGGSWRWAYDGTNYYWQVIGDTATQKALAMAGAAQDTADGKRRNFITTPAPPYDTGDTWTQGGTVKVCTTSKVFGGSFSSDDWRRAGDVTADNTAKNTSSISGAVNASVDLGGANYNTGTIGWVWKYLPAAQGLVDGGYLDASYRLTHYYGADNKLYRIRALASLDKANLDSNIEDGTTYRRVGSGYVDTSHRISGIYDGTLGAIRPGSYLGTGASRAWSGLDANGLLADQKTPVTRLSGRTLANIYDDPAGGRFASQFDATQQSDIQTRSLQRSFGPELLVDPDFELNSLGKAYPIDFQGAAAGTVVTDGWVVGTASSAIKANIYQSSGYTPPHHGAHSLLYQVTNGCPPVPTGAGYVGIRLYSNEFPVTALANYRLRGWRYIISTNLPDGVDILVRLGIQWSYSDGTHPETVYDLSGASTGGYVETDVYKLAPTDALSAKIQVCVFVRNLTGADWTPSNSSNASAFFDNLSFKQATVEDAGGGVQFGDGRNAPMSSTGNYGSVWLGNRPSYASTASSATITMPAQTLQVGSNPIAYNASTVSVSGPAGGTQHYWLYYVDDAYAGGARTLYATTNDVEAWNANDKLFVDDLVVAFQSGGGGGGGGFGCAMHGEWVIRRGAGGRAEIIDIADVEVDDMLQLYSGGWARVTRSVAARHGCMRLRTAGAEFNGSCSGEMALAHGGWTMVAHAKGCLLQTIVGNDRGAERVLSLDPLGVQWTQEVSLEGPDKSFRVGHVAGYWLAHHNIKKNPGV